MAVQFVGGATASKVGATSGNSTVALNSGLTGGIASAAAAGDLVIAVYGTGSTADRTLAITSGYTLIASELYSNDTFDTNLRVAYKFMGGTPDTATTFGPTGNTADAGAMAVYVFRGVDPDTPLDVAAVTGQAINTSRVVPPDITPSTAGAFPVVAGAAAHNGGVDTFTSSDLTDFRTVGGNDTNDVTIGVGHQDNWSSGATNYATWGHSQADSTGFCWAAVTFVLRPDAAGQVTTPQTIPATAVGAPSLSRATTRFRALPATAIASPTVATISTRFRALAATAIGTAVLTSASVVGQVLAATAIGVAILSAALLISISMAATAVGTAAISMAAVFGQAVAATAIGAASLVARFIEGVGGGFPAWARKARGHYRMFFRRR